MMRIVKQGNVPVESLIHGKCDECGREVEFYPREGYRNYRNASGEDHRSGRPTYYYIDCLTKNCNGKVSGREAPEAPKTTKPSLFDRFFNYKFISKVKLNGD